MRTEKVSANDNSLYRAMWECSQAVMICLALIEVVEA